MTAQQSSPFLDGTGVSVALGDIEAELLRLWGPAAVEAGGDADESNVTRVVLANLLVEVLEDPRRVSGVLETVMARHPCRAIVLRPGASAPRRIEADVSALCHLPAPGLPQVCSEQINLRTGAEAAGLLPGAVRPLLESDLPLILWWTSDPSGRVELFHQLAHEATRIIVDLPDPAPARAIATALDRAIHPYSRDAVWFTATSWRTLLAQLFDPSCLKDALGRIARVDVEVESPDSSRPPRAGVWLAAWLAGQLGWNPFGKPAVERSSSECRLDASFHAGHGVVSAAVLWRTNPDLALAAPRIVAVTLTCQGIDGDTTIHLARTRADSPAVRVDVTTPTACHLPRLVEAPEPDQTLCIAAALESSRTDPPFDRARPIALWMLEAGEPA